VLLFCGDADLSFHLELNFLNPPATL
jgi:hypothetical protein